MTPFAIADSPVSADQSDWSQIILALRKPFLCQIVHGTVQNRVSKWSRRTKLLSIHSTFDSSIVKTLVEISNWPKLGEKSFVKLLDFVRQNQVHNERNKSIQRSTIINITFF